jgi:hypothetical protein
MYLYMSEFLKMDIFFAVTTMVVFFFGIMGMVALYYMIRILRNIAHVARNVSEESDNVREDVKILREKARSEGIRITHLMDFFLGMKERRRASSKKEKVAKEVF